MLHADPRAFMDLEPDVHAKIIAKIAGMNERIDIHAYVQGIKDGRDIERERIPKPALSELSLKLLSR